MFRVFIEGYEQKVASVQVKTGRGVLQASIVLPPGPNRRRILPGSRVYVYLRHEGKWIAWFQGVTVNMPENAIGLDESPVTLSILGDLGLLQSVSMSYVNIGAQDPVNQTYKSTTLSGKGNIPKGAGMLGFPFSQVIADSTVDFGARVLGLLQTLVSLDPQGWEDLRRIQYLHRLSIVMADQIAQKLDQSVLMNSVANVLSQLQMPEFTALDILNLILELTLHELVSIAPIRYSNGNLLKTPNRGAFYLPPTLTITELSIKNQLDVAKAMCMVHETEALTDHFIKPVDRFIIPDENNISKNQYNNLSVSDYAPTRAIAKIPMFPAGKNMTTMEELYPDQLKRFWDITRGAAGVAEKSPSFGCMSNVLTARINGVRTNREKVMGGVRMGGIHIGRNVYACANLMASEEKGKATATEYINSVLAYEFEKTQGTGVTISGGTFNPMAIPGFGISIEGANGTKYIGKLVTKIDTIDLGSSSASTQYVIESCRAEGGYNYDATLREGYDCKTIDTTFQKYEESPSNYVSPLFSSSATVLRGDTFNMTPYKQSVGPYDPTKLTNALKATVPQSIWLAHNHLIIRNNEMMADDGEQRDGDFPTVPTRWSGPGERYYNYIDMISHVAQKTLVGTEDLFYTKDPVDLSLLPPLTSKESVAILDGKDGNIYSVGSILQGNTIIKNKIAIDVYNKMAQIRQKTATNGTKTMFTVSENIVDMKDVAALFTEEPEAHLVNEYIDMIAEGIPQFPLWEGNPCPLRLEILLYILSGMPVDQYKSFFESGTTSGFSFSAATPVPLSDRQVIMMRRDIARRAKDE